jgi:hypothetical protein
MREVTSSNRRAICSNRLSITHILSKKLINNNAQNISL